MFAYGVALSYSVLHRIALAAGLPPWAARLWPLGFEAFMASAALNALADQRQRHHRPDWWRRVSWYPWALTALTAGGSILLNWFHPAIPLDPPPGWLVSLVYGLPPLAAVFAWHLFLQRLAHRRQQEPASHGSGPVLAGQERPEDKQDKQDKQDLPPPASTHLAPAPGPADDPRARIRDLLTTETPDAPVGWQQVQAQTGLSRSRAYALLRQERTRADGNGQQPSGHTTNWRGRPLVSHEVIVELIGATTTRSGLNVRAALDKGAYPLGVRVSDRELAAVPLRRHDWHGEWNYTVLPTAA
jgi:hypothetical protein